MSGHRKSSLSAGNRRLVELLSSIGFGRVEELVVRGGEAVLEPPPRVVRERLLGSAGAGRHGCPADFAVRKQVTELLEALRQLGNGVVQVLEVRHGLPFRLVIVDPRDPQQMRA